MKTTPTLRQELEAEILQRRTRDDNIKAGIIPLWGYMYLAIVVFSLVILILHPFIIKLVDSNI